MAVERRREFSDFQSLPEDVPKFLEKLEERDNQFIQEVKLRYDRITAICSDMPSAEVKYHRNCYSMFLIHGCKLGTKAFNSGRPECPAKSKSFDLLIEYLKDNDESQYSLQKILDIFASYLPADEISYTDKWMKKKLKNYFGDEIIITDTKKTCFITFKENMYKILRQGWKTKTLESDEEKMLIIDMAASIVRDSIRSKPFHLNQYEDLSNLNLSQIDSDIPIELKRFVGGVIKTKSNVFNNVTERRRAAISHSVISACRPRSFVSSLMLSLSLYVYKKYESRILVDILSSLGYGASYEEVVLYLNNVSNTP